MNVAAPINRPVFPGSNGKPYPALRALIDGYGPGGTAPEVLMFGDSVAERVSKHDKDTRRLVDMVCDEIGRSFLGITRSAQNPILYQMLLMNLAVQPKRPQQIIIPVNMRCFSPQWDLNPYWQLSQEMNVLLSYHFHRTTDFPDIKDVPFDPAAHEAFEATPVFYPLSNLRTVGEFQALVRSSPKDEVERTARSREIFVYHYTHPLHSGHRKLTGLLKAVEFAKSMGDVLVYVTPINVEAGLRHVGPAFATALQRNVSVVEDALSDMGVTMQDWSALLPESAFFHEDLATEHLNENGRSPIASAIAAWPGR